ncbi:Protein kinase of the Mitotic Exit Network, variant 2 [Entomophthora muscae]|uniref:Protein kinase of the Mitotic Exit Network, variant 2 n=1 Tax=Entomophthora muscae TaxID=34485 RepID=A0ACC2U5Q2_9FUNG|nr:Protein kinase of the Mitotic Exit Network, variant 2 [Entomophthora muscae]
MARVYLTILTVARKLCKISFSKKSDRDSNRLSRIGMITDEKIFSDLSSPETSKSNLTSKSSFTETQPDISPVKRNYQPPSSSSTNLVVSPPKFFTPPVFSTKQLLKNSTLPEPLSIPKAQPPTYNASSSTTAQKSLISPKPLKQPPFSPTNTERFSPTSPDSGVSDKIKNLLKFFDSGSHQPPSSKPISRGASRFTDPNGDRAISSPNLLSNLPMKGSFSTPVSSRLYPEDDKEANPLSSFESDVSSHTQIDAVIHAEPISIVQAPVMPHTDKVPTVKDRIVKPLNYRVGRGGIIEDLDLSIKKVQGDNARRDVLRLDNIDWDLDDEEDDFCEDDASYTNNDVQASDAPAVDRPGTSHCWDAKDRDASRSRRVRHEAVQLKKQHSRNHSEKPQLPNMDSLPVTRPRAGSAGPSDFPKDRLSLFFENSKLLAQYQLGDCIGKGQFGSVYKALNLHTGQIVAVKRVDLDGRSKEEIESLMGEVDLLKSLSHVRVVNYEGYVKTEASLNIVLEYVENGSLLQLLRSYGPLPAALVASFTSQILEGLMYLHDKQVVHCDLKAANILSNKNGKIKLTDFGVSLNLKVKDSDLGEIVAGTPNWMAPEVITLQGASTASDIWSLGCTIVELLTEKPPYSDMNAMAALYRIVEDDCPPLPKNISPSLDDFLRSCFKKKPTKRPTAEELSYHDWIIETQLSYGVNNKLKIINTEKLVEQKKRESQITESLWESSYLNADSTLLTPPASTTTSRLPNEQPISASEHNFIRSTFSKRNHLLFLVLNHVAISCKVCKSNLKKQAMMCADCKIICHSGCVDRVKILCQSNNEEPIRDLPQFSSRKPTRRHVQIARSPQRRVLQPSYSEGTIASGSHRDYSISPTPNKSTLPWASHHKTPRQKKRHNDDCCIS